MAVHNANTLAQENLFETAKACAQAALKAPQISGTSRIQMEIVTGEDLAPMIDALFVLGRIEMFNLLSYFCWKTLYDEKRPPVLLLIGADLKQSDLQWNCGACGFPTCAEFNKYSKKVPAVSRYMIQGPTCHWKLIDYSIACDWACAAAWQNNVTNRIEAASGMAAAAVGHLPDCSIVLGLPVGPCEDMFWYNRPVLNNVLTHDMWIERMMDDFPVHFSAFFGNGRQEVKASDRWWEAPRKRKALEQDPAILKKMREEVNADLEEIKKRRLSLRKGGA